MHVKAMTVILTVQLQYADMDAFGPVPATHCWNSSFRRPNFMGSCTLDTRASSLKAGSSSDNVIDEKSMDEYPDFYSHYDSDWVSTITTTAITLLLSWEINGQLTEQELNIFRSYNVTTSSHSNDYWLFEHTGIPTHSYGSFPNEDNPNSVTVQNHRFYIPKSPKNGTSNGCLNLGTVAVAISGIPYYNPYTSEGFNAVSGSCRETFDNCDGHPQTSGAYHYHQIPTCLYNNSGRNQLLGVALDGWPIMGPIDENGKTLTSVDLDLCHGRYYNGRYQYHMTYDFPYIISCYHGPTSSPTGKRSVSENVYVTRVKRNTGCTGVSGWSSCVCVATAANPGIVGCSSAANYMSFAKEVYVLSAITILSLRLLIV